MCRRFDRVCVITIFILKNGHLFIRFSAYKEERLKYHPHGQTIIMADQLRLVDPEQDTTSRSGDREGSAYTRFMRMFTVSPRVERIFTEELVSTKDKPLSIGVVGCATGEEAYSYSMLAAGNGYTNFIVDGYDKAKANLDTARRGKYLVEREAEFLGKRGFAKYRKLVKKQKDNPYFTLADEVKDRTRFSQHDITQGPLPNQYDIVVCSMTLPFTGNPAEASRNVLRSLKPEQSRGLVVTEWPVAAHADFDLCQRVNKELQRELRLGFT